MSASATTRWRPAYEAYPACSWAIVAAGALYLSSTGLEPSELLLATASVAAALAVFRAIQAALVMRQRWGLEPRELEWISSEELAEKMRAKPDHIWLGRGFDWTPAHSQLLHDAQRADLESLRVPGAFLRDWLNRKRPPKKGSPLLHGVEPVERDIYVPLDHINGHVFVPGTTGALKTRLLALMANQAIRRTPRETVVVIDPKGDRALRDMLRDECRATGRDDFGFFHPARPAESIRIDPVATWNRATEVASRIGALIPSESGNDPWSAFGWRVVHAVIEGCVASHRERPTLATIRRYVEGGVDQLLKKALIQKFEEEGLDWRTKIQPYHRQVGRARNAASTDAELLALVAYYKAEWQQAKPISPIDGLVSMSSHDREHAQKMLSSLIPILTMLTAGDLAGLLSPDRLDSRDQRPILTSASIVESAAVIYIGLDALSDSVVASAIASILTADLAAHAGARFNLGINHPILNLFFDEVSDSVNAPFIQLLNKGRGAGYRLLFLGQTFSDFVTRLGSEAGARQAVGNANSIIAGRTKDSVTAQYVMEDFGQTILRSVLDQDATATLVGGRMLTHARSFGVRESETQTELIPLDALSKLPDLEYFASFSGSRIVKGRIPLVYSGRRRTGRKRG